MNILTKGKQIVEFLYVSVVLSQTPPFKRHKEINMEAILGKMAFCI